MCDYFEAVPPPKFRLLPERGTGTQSSFLVYETTFCTAEQHCVAPVPSERPPSFHYVSLLCFAKTGFEMSFVLYQWAADERMWGARCWWAADSSWEPWQQHSHNSCCSASGRDATESREDEREKRVWWICKWTPEQSWIILKQLCHKKTAFKMPMADSLDHIWLTVVSAHLRKWSVCLFWWAHTAVLRPRRGKAVGKP